MELYFNIFIVIFIILRVYKIWFGMSVCWTSILGGVVQTVLYGDFLYYYVKSTGRGKMTIPV